MVNGVFKDVWTKIKNFFSPGTSRELGPGEKAYVDICTQEIAGKIKTIDNAPKIRPHVRKFQKFCELRDACLRKKKLFVDPEFPAEDTSLFFSKSPPKRIKWLRPKEISKQPAFWGPEGPSRVNLLQGEVGNCWLIAAVANLALFPELVYKVVPENQSFRNDYAGIFIFHFWKYGKWIDVVVDDRLPCYGDQLVYMRSVDRNEFWCALLEKAYAKIHGSYEALISGNIAEAMVDLTGGIAEVHNVKEERGLFHILMNSLQRQSLVGCNIQITDEGEMEEITKEGLIKGHAYSITKVAEILYQLPKAAQMVQLIRLRNPWGGAHEWKGAWSDRSREWQYVSTDEKEELDLIFHHDGEFWMSFDDFQKRFDLVEICNLTPDALATSKKMPWDYHVFEGEWTSGTTAGGCTKNINTFWQNPQYRITLSFADPEGDGKCTMCVSLMQKYRRSMKKLGKDFLAIGFTIYHLSGEYLNIQPTPLKFFLKHNPVGMSRVYTDSREVYKRFRLPPGNYLLIPATYYPNSEGEFLIRVFATGEFKMRENDRQLAMLQTSQKTKIYEHEILAAKYIKIFEDMKELEIGWKKLKIIMDHFAVKIPHFKGFSKEIVRSAIAMVDDNRNGKIDIYEFDILMRRLALWKIAFKTIDTRQIGILPPFNLRSFMDSIGYELNNTVLNMIEHRYGRDDGSLYFDDCMMSAIKVAALFDTYKRQLEQKVSISDLRLVDWLEATIFS